MIRNRILSYGICLISIVVLMSSANARTENSTIDSIENYEKRWNRVVSNDEGIESRASVYRVLPRLDHALLPSIVGSSKPKIVGFQVDGSRLLTKKRTLSLLGGYLNKKITTQLLLELVATVREYYSSNDYLQNGIWVDESDFKDGVVKLFIQETKVTKVQLKGNRSLDKGVVMRDIEAALSSPINKRALADSVAILKSNALVREVDAYLYPLDKINNYALFLDIKE